MNIYRFEARGLGVLIVASIYPQLALFVCRTSWRMHGSSQTADGRSLGGTGCQQQDSESDIKMVSGHIRRPGMVHGVRLLTAKTWKIYVASMLQSKHHSEIYLDLLKDAQYSTAAMMKTSRWK